MASERLQKILAASGVASRRASEVLIAAGRVTVDGKVAQIGAQVDPLKAIIAVDGRVIGGAAAPEYLLLHKPPGVTSTVRDRHASRTVVEMIPTAMIPEGARLYPVGRLDQDSEGLLVLTNDGAWADRVLHPRHGIEREYAIGLRGPLTKDQVDALKAGIPLDEGLATLTGLRATTEIETRRLIELISPRPGDLVWYRSILAQGWKRQLRRMFGAVGAPIERLVRVRMGPVRLDDLPSGRARRLRAPEIRGLGAGAGTSREGVRGDRAGARDTRAAEPPDAAARRPRQGHPRRAADQARLVVALDGPGSSGKSSVGAAAALRVGYRFCDTGLLYRAVTWLSLARHVPATDPDALRALAAHVELAADAAGRLARVLVDGVDRTGDVHTPPVDAAVSAVSAVPRLRAALLQRQRALAAAGGIVMAGRDIGTVVLPNADLKLFLDASVEERARRRAEERALDPGGAEAVAILTALRRRDDQDSTRTVAPLFPAADARIIATDGNRFEDTVDAVVGAILDAQARRAAAPEPTGTRTHRDPMTRPSGR